MLQFVANKINENSVFSKIRINWASCTWKRIVCWQWRWWLFAMQPFCFYPCTTSQLHHLLKTCRLSLPCRCGCHGCCSPATSPPSRWPRAGPDVKQQGRQASTAVFVAPLLNHSITSLAGIHSGVPHKPSQLSTKSPFFIRSVHSRAPYTPDACCRFSCVIGACLKISTAHHDT